jgi:hypothetical protein
MEDKYYFIKRMNEKILWTYKPKVAQRILYVFSTIFWVPLPILLLGVLLCVFNVTKWPIMILFVVLSLLSYLIAFLSTFFNKELEYIVTNKSIIILTGNAFSKFKFDEIKSLKVTHNLFNRKIGNIKIELFDKKNLFNHLVGIKDVDTEHKKVSTIVIDHGNSMYNL